MNKTTILSSDHSPVNWLLNHFNNWTKGENVNKSALATRAIALLAGSAFALLSATYQTIAFAVKAPGTLLKYAVIIPIKVHGEWWTLGGYVFSNKTFELTEMLKHVYKTAAFAFDIVLFPTVGLISPIANIKMHEIFKLVIIDRGNNEAKGMQKSLIRGPRHLPRSILNNSNLVKKEIENKKVKIYPSNKNSDLNNNLGSSVLYQKELASKLALRKAKEAEEIKLEQEAIIQHNKKEIEPEKPEKDGQENVIIKQFPVLEDVLEVQLPMEGFVNINGQLYDYDPAVNPFANVAINVMPPEANQLAVIENLVEINGELFNYDPSLNPFASGVNLNEIKLDQVAIKIISSKRALPIPKPIITSSESNKKIIPMFLPSKGLFGTENLVEQFSKDPSSVKDSVEVKNSLPILDVFVDKLVKESFAENVSEIEIPLLETDHSELVEKTFSPILENKGLPKLLFSTDDLKHKAKILTNQKFSSKSSLVSFKEEEDPDNFLKASMAARRKAFAPEDEIISVKSAVTKVDSPVKHEPPVVEVEGKKPKKIEPPIIRPAFNFCGNDFLVKKNSLANVKELELKVIVEEPLVVVNQWDSVVSSFQDKAKDSNLIASDECDWEDD
ncbi:MAG: hypothetical protein H0W50_05705 [Parachlamydiaceae bacterium]|nr:hypothetical protein [Parachlamydiaceae bacterium]